MKFTDNVKGYQKLTKLEENVNNKNNTNFDYTIKLYQFSYSTIFPHNPHNLKNSNNKATV